MLNQTDLRAMASLNDDDKPEGNEGEKVREKSPGIEERLFKGRTILIYGGIDQKVAKDVSARLLALQYSGDEPITIYINSQGGHVESGDTIYDMIKFVKPEVRVVGTGWVASAGALIYVAAKKENRFALPNTRFLLHQPAGGAMGPASDVAIQAKEIIRMRRRLNEIFARETGQPIEKIEKDTDRDFWISAEDAVSYGLVGKIVQNVTEVG